MKRSSVLFGHVGRSVAVLTLALLPSCTVFHAHSASDIHQAIWVTRWDYRTEADIRQIVRNCAKNGFDTVLFQVRGNGTVSYTSQIEPWAEEFGFKNPGFDPLAVACDEARLQGVALHAWINAVPGWRGASPPAHEGQLFHTRPEWFLVDQNGERQPLAKDRYVDLNPCLPAVREHVARICEEVALRYPVDGIHLDYVRFGDYPEGHDYPHDATTLALYDEQTGKKPADDAEAWHAWKTAQVSELVRLIRKYVRRANRKCVLTAAVLRLPELALAKVNQDWVTWLQRGRVHAVFPMQYDANDERFAARSATCLEAAGGKPCILGIGAYLHEDPEQTLRQMRKAKELGATGFSLFAYSSFFRGAREGTAGSPKDASLRRVRRETVLPAVQAGRRLGGETETGSRP